MMEQTQNVFGGILNEQFANFATAQENNQRANEERVRQLVAEKLQQMEQNFRTREAAVENELANREARLISQSDADQQLIAEAASHAQDLSAQIQQLQIHLADANTLNEELFRLNETLHESRSIHFQGYLEQINNIKIQLNVALSALNNSSHPCNHLIAWDCTDQNNKRIQLTSAVCDHYRTEIQPQLVAYARIEEVKSNLATISDYMDVLSQSMQT